MHLPMGRSLVVIAFAGLRGQAHWCHSRAALPMGSTLVIIAAFNFHVFVTGLDQSDAAKLH